MAEWTRERVEERLIEAAEVMKRLPPVRVQGYFSVWPAILPEFGDLVGREPPRLRRPAPAPDAIDRMEAAMPSGLGGLVARPMIAVPTSVGYGVGQDGLVALAAMLSSCAPGITVVNIDNGVGAAIAAVRVARLAP